MSTQRPARAAALALTILLLAGCAQAAEEPTGAPSPEVPTTTAEPEQPPSDEPTGPTEEPTSGGEVPPDWQEVDFGDGTFMVPPGWEIEPYDANGVPRERALYGTGSCPEAPESATGLAFIGWVPGETDPAAALEAEAHRMATSAFADRSPQVELSDLQTGGEWVGGVAAVTMDPSDEPCAPVEAVFVLKAAAADGGVFVFTVIGELGLDASPTPEELVEISNSLLI